MKLVFYTALAISIITGCATNNNVTSEDAVASVGNSTAWQRIQSASAQPVAIRYFGFIDVTQDEDSESQYFEAGFARFEDTAPLNLLLDNFRQPTVDSCDYHQQERGDSTPLELKDELELPGYPYTFISAGETIDVKVGKRRYAKLSRTSTNPDDAVQYETDVGSLPVSLGGFKFGDLLLKTRGLILATAGDTFPAFSNITVPPIDSVANFKPGKNARISANTRLTWRTGRYADDPDVRVQIEAGGGGRAVFCAVADDGEFQLPDDTQSQLHDASIPNPSAFRDSVWFYVYQNALLIVSQSSYY